jgi:hypothetical protein
MERRKTCKYYHRTGRDWGNVIYVSVSQNVQRRKVGGLMNNELERMGKEAAVVACEAFQRHLLGWTEENTKNL